MEQRGPSAALCKAESNMNNHHHPPPSSYSGPLLPPLMPIWLSPPSISPSSTAENPAKRRPSSDPDDERSPHPSQRSAAAPPDWRRHHHHYSRARPDIWATRRVIPGPTATDRPERDAETGPSSSVGSTPGTSTTTTATPPTTAPGSAPPPAAPRFPPAGSVGAATSPYVRRKRAIAACQFCRLRKTKCDNVRPVCGSCRHHQARCVYADGSEGDGLQLGTDEAIGRHREVIARLDDIRNLLARTTLPDGPRSSSASERASVVSPSTGNHFDQDSAELGIVETESVSDRQTSSSTTAYLQYTKCESILKWPILHGVIDDEDAAIDSFIFDAHVLGDEEECEVVTRPRAGCSASPASCSGMSNGQQTETLPLFGRGVGEHSFVPLCQKFLTLVNCRNPIVDAHDLLSYARCVAQDGLGWDAKSCLVLLACALACYSRSWTPPPDKSTPSPAARRDSTTVPHGIMSSTDDEAAEHYYAAAQKRLGSLGSSLVDVQCFFYASLFERYAFRPLEAWMYIQQAATRLRVHHLGRRKGDEKRRQGNDRDQYHTDSGLLTISYHFQQRAFWAIHKAERVFATELGITLASDLTGFQYPAAFPTPPESLNNSATGDDADMSDIFSPQRNEFVWFFFLAEISLRRTLDEVLSVIYEKGEQNWIENIDLVCRQYHESEKQISDWQSHLPPTMRYNPVHQPNNEMGYYLESRFEEWNECILRPLVYYCLHYPPTKPPTRAIVALAQREMTLCENCILRCATQDRHGGTWIVLRRVFRCTLIMLAAVVADGPLRPPENWRELTSTSVATIARWSAGVRSQERMGRVLERAFRAVCDAVARRTPVGGESGGAGGSW